ncbi:MAG: Protein translocase subunit SecA [Parcubacteria group bacterium GW2011_GWA2_49_9]|nr:MAG: Protein translocase subunit SecA [Parcubacteria group bacterium GW2011_GWA2_49_9]
MEDTLMRVFAADTIKSVMGKFGIPEDEPIENRMITRSLESAQTKIEGFNFDSRKHVLEYDNVLNHQRTVIYERRRKMLLGGPEAVDEYLTMLSAGESPLEKGVPPSSEAGVVNFGKLVEQKKQQLGAEFYPAISRLILQTIDLFWVEHLEVMDYLRGSVNLRAYGQRDPLVEYKREGLKLFKDMEENIVNQVLHVFPHVGGAPIQEQVKLQEVHEQAQLIGSGDEESDAQHHGNIPLNKGGGLGGLSSSRSEPKNPDGSRIGRNDPCFCGSGKKYKKCHGV